MASEDRFIELVFNDNLTSEKLVDFLNRKYPDILPKWEYHCIYTLCSGKDREHRHKLVRTFFEYYKNNPISINESLINMIVINLRDFELLKYFSELCTYTNYAPIKFTQGILNNICWHNRLNMLKYIINLPNICEQRHYTDIMKNINITELLSSNLSSRQGTDMILYLIKYSKNNKKIYTSYNSYDEKDDETYHLEGDYMNDLFDKFYLSLGIKLDKIHTNIFI